MGTGKCLSLLVLTAILGNYGPHRPPGSRSGGKDADTAACTECHQLSDMNSGNRFFCENCGSWFEPSEENDSGADS